MKFFYLFLVFAFFSCEVFAEQDVDLGIIKQLVTEETAEAQGEEPEAFTPRFANSLVYDVSFNDEYQSTNRQNEFHETRSKGRLNSSFYFAKNFSLNSFLKFERMSQASELARRSALPEGGGNRTFENEGLYIEELNVAYDSKKQAFILGKFDLNFGTAWRFNRGIWTYQIAEGYRQREKLGINGIYRMGNSATTGRYELSYALFTNDRKNLDNSIITGRDSASKSDGLPGDTRSLQSFITSLDISFDFAEKEKLTYHFSYINMAVNAQASTVTPALIADQNGWVAGMNYKYPLAENLILDGLVEFAEVKNFGGNSDADEDYLTANLISRFYEHWNVTFGYAKHHNRVRAVSSYDKNLSEISAGYEFKKTAIFDKLLFQVGYKNQRDDYKTSFESRNVFGVLMRLQKAF